MQRKKVFLFLSLIAIFFTIYFFSFYQRELVKKKRKGKQIVNNNNVLQKKEKKVKIEEEKEEIFFSDLVKVYLLFFLSLFLAFSQGKKAYKRQTEDNFKNRRAKFFLTSFVATFSYIFSLVGTPLAFFFFRSLILLIVVIIFSLMNAQKKTFQRIFKFYEFFELKNIFSKQPYHFFIFFFFSLVVYMFIRSIIFQDYSNFMNDPTAGDDHNPQELALNPNYINRGQADPNSMENIPLSFHLSMRYLMFLMPFIFFLRIRRVVVYKKKDKNKENSPEEKKEKENYLSV